MQCFDKAPERLETARLILRRPRPDDAARLLTSYSGSETVCRYLGWPRHRSLADTRQFLEFSDAEWVRWPAGPYVATDRGGQDIIGSTGLAFESPHTASTGYVIAEPYWRNGFATEALAAMVDLAGMLGVRRLYALCHPDHRASQRVLEKCGFRREPDGVPIEFPNLDGGVTATAACYARDPRGEGSAKG